MAFVFVYGTLKRGYPNFHLAMSDLSFVGVFQTIDAYPLVVAGRWFSPVMIDDRGNGHLVKGEVFEVGAAELARIDYLESTHLPNGYRRIEMSVASLADGRRIDAWSYVKDRARLDIVHGEAMAQYRFDPRYVPAGSRQLGSTT